MGGDDHDLARLLAARDGHAFRLLVERETSYVFRICWRILGRVDEAEDAAQETFMLAYRAMSTFRGGDPRAWLARIAARESFRRARARRSYLAATAPLDEGIDATVRDSADPLADVLAAEEGRLVRRVVAGLPEPYREVVALRYFSDLSLADIAALTGRPLGTVKAQLYRGLERLRRQLGEEPT